MIVFSSELAQDVRQLTLEVFEFSRDLPTEGRGKLRRAAAAFASAVGRGAGMQPRAAFKAGAETLAQLRGLQRLGLADRAGYTSLVGRVQQTLSRVYRQEAS